jgi:hypothetical protein
LGRIFQSLIALTFILALAGCGDSYSWHQQLTIKVNTPEGIKVGSSVTKVTVTRYDGWWVFPEARGVKGAVEGEAVVVDLGRGQYLFALLSGPEKTRATHFAPKTFSRETGWGRQSDVGWPAWPKAIIAQKGLPKQVPPEAYPFLVTFGSVNSPASVKQVDPYNLGAAFGPGYALHSIVLEITDAPVTTGQVEKVLEWLLEIWPNKLDGDRYEHIRASNRLANALSANSFSTEIKK